MRVWRPRRSILVVASVIGALSTTCVVAQTPEISVACANADGALSPNESAAACTQVLQRRGLTPSTTLAALRGRAQAYAQGGQWDEAVADFTRAIERAPADATLFKDRGNAHFNAGREDAALDDYQRALALNPNFPEALHNRGLIYLRRGEATRALADYDASLALKPDFAMAFFHRAELHAAQGDWPAALADYASAGRHDATYIDRARASRAQIYLRRRDMAALRALYRDAAAAEPKRAVSIMIEHADLLREAGDFAGEIAALDQAISLDAEDNGAISARAQAYLDHGDYQRALDDFVVMEDMGLGVSPDTRCWVRAAAGRDLAAGLSACNEALGARKTPAAPVLDSRGLIHLKLGQYAPARRDYDAAWRRDRTEASYVYGRGVANLWLGRVREGQADLATAAAMNAGIAETYRRLGVLADQPRAPATTPAPGQRFRECDDCPEMIVAPAGRFTMGAGAGEPAEEGVVFVSGPRFAHHDAGAPHNVRRRIHLRRPFAVGVTEVTRGQFARFAAAMRREDRAAAHVRAWQRSPAFQHCSGPGHDFEPPEGASWRNPGFEQTDTHPVVCVSWDDARSYVNWLNAHTGGGYRLLSEAEWEYAARAVTRTRYPWGEDAHAGCAYANAADAALKARAESVTAMTCDDGAVFTSPVGARAPNAFGLYDMIGNVWELTADSYETSLRRTPSDGRAYGADDVWFHVRRGGGWEAPPEALRSAARRGATPSLRYTYVGFRVAKTLP